MEKIKQLFIKYREIITYLIVGGCTTLVNFLVYTPLISFTPLSMTVCNGIAWFFAVIFAYITNKLFVFRSTDRSANVLVKEILTFLGSRILSGAVEIVLPTLLFSAGLTMSFLGIEGFAAKITASIIVVIMNYVVSKLIVFRKKE